MIVNAEIAQGIPGECAELNITFKEREGMNEIIVSAAVSLVVSAVYCKISAVHTLDVIDGYVKSVIDMAKKSIRDANSDE